jgi:predicted histidine transporter YuiF (NhaC family)
MNLSKHAAVAILAFWGSALAGESIAASDVLLGALAGAINQYNFDQLTPEQQLRVLQRQHMQQQLQYQQQMQQQLQQIRQNQEQLRQQQEWDQMTRRR